MKTIDLIFRNSEKNTFVKIENKRINIGKVIKISQEEPLGEEKNPALIFSYAREEHLRNFQGNLNLISEMLEVPHYLLAEGIKDNQITMYGIEIKNYCILIKAP